MVCCFPKQTESVSLWSTIELKCTSDSVPILVYFDIVEAHCYGFQMISSDNELSRSRHMQ